MEEFKTRFADPLVSHMNNMVKKFPVFYRTDVCKEEIWDTYLESFPEPYNKMYKEKREYDCNTCKSFIRNYGNIVAINDKCELISIWDIEGLETPYKEVAEELSSLVKSRDIKNIFLTKERKLGTAENHQMMEDGKVITWYHFHFTLPGIHSKLSTNYSSIPQEMSFHRDNYSVFKKSMEELTEEAGKIILDITEQGSLYRGNEYKKQIETFVKMKKEYSKVKERLKNVWLWKSSMDNPVSRIKNTAIGTLLEDISKGEDLDSAVRKYEAIMAPSNYKRPKPLVTERMIKEAEKKAEELGIIPSLKRRFAHIDDITVNNILFVDRDDQSKLKSSPFDSIRGGIPDIPKKFSKVEEVHITEFVEKILPHTTKVELLLESRHTSNLMSLIAPEDPESTRILKWDNNFSWSYNGDITDSMKQRVKAAGGKVDGVLRFSIQWNDNGDNLDDLDAHCHEPTGHIFFSNMKVNSGGNLDVDIIDPESQTKDGVAVENITWPSVRNMREGEYRFSVHNFSNRGGRSGFSAEIEYNGEIHKFEYDQELKNKETIEVAILKILKSGDKLEVEWVKSLTPIISTKKIWEVSTNKFTKVRTIMLSPNHWDGQKGKGNKHYFFILDKCKNDTNPRGFFNEFLRNELEPHRKVFEILGSKMRVEASDKQLSGVGFSDTQRNSILARIEGSISRSIMIIF